MRAIWKGHIRFSLVTIPVAIYNAIETSETISFRQLHKDDNGQIGYDKRCKKCNEIVRSEDIVKGFPHSHDQFVIMEPSDFDKVKLKSTKVIEIEGFIDVKDIHPTLYDTPYYAGPDGEVAAQAYRLLCEALRDSNKLGIGRVVIRDRENVMLLAPQEKGLLLYRLRYPAEIRSIKEMPRIDDIKIDKEQLKLAKTLISSMEKKYASMNLKDRYKDALRDVIKAKVEGKELVAMEEEKKPVVDIMTALRSSIDQAKKEKKPMKKASGEQKREKMKRKPKAAGKSRKQRIA